MILEYDRSPGANADQKIQSLMESVQRAFNNIDAGTLTGNMSTLVRINGGSLFGIIDGDYVFVKNLDADSIKAVNEWVDKLLVQTNLLANDGQIFTLDAIEVNAANITAGTLDVERIILTIDGEKYMFDPRGHYEKTKDTTIVSGKTYYVRTGTDPNYVYVEVDNPVQADIGNYYEFLTYEKLDGDIIEDLTITADKIVSGSIMTRHITTQDIEGTSGWINLRNGTFFYGNGVNFATADNAIYWDGSKLKIKADDFYLSSGKSIFDEIDEIETWFYATDPTLANEPAVNWTTFEAKQMHLRDIYYNTDSGHSFRWAVVEVDNPTGNPSTSGYLELVNGEYVPSTDTSVDPLKTYYTFGWMEIVDADLEAALERLSDAETAISQNADSIVSLASANATYITPTGNTATNALTTKITQTATSIESLAANNATYTKPDGTTGTNLMQSAISQNASNITLKVSKDNVISEINMSPESISVDAGRIDVLTKDGTSGIYLHPSSQSPSSGSEGNSVKINANGMEIFKGNTSVAFYGDTARVGKTSSGYTTIQGAGMKVYGNDGTTELANIGYGLGNAETGTAQAPYYTLGKRKENSAIGNWSVAEGQDVTASAFASHAEGRDTTASGNCSHAEGANVGIDSTEYYTTASGYASHAEGGGTLASGGTSHAEGRGTTASGDASHAEGYQTTASNQHSHAEGYQTTASGYYAHAQNFCTIAASNEQTAIGRFNIADSAHKYAFIIGNGSDSARSDALTVEWNGNVDIANGAKYKINGADLSAADVGAVPTTRTVNSKALSSDITLSASDVSAVPTTRTVNGKALSSNITLSASDVSAVPTTRTVNSKALSSNITLTADDVSAVPTTRTVNSKALSSNITLTASDVSAVPNTRKVNNKALSSDITLSASDVDAVPTTRTINGNALSSNVTLTLTTSELKDTASIPSTVAGGQDKVDFSLSVPSGAVISGIKSIYFTSHPGAFNVMGWNLNNDGSLTVRYRNVGSSTYSDTMTVEVQTLKIT